MIFEVLDWLLPTHINRNYQKSSDYSRRSENLSCRLRVKKGMDCVKAWTHLKWGWVEFRLCPCLKNRTLPNNTVFLLLDESQKLSTLNLSSVDLSLMILWFDKLAHYKKTFLWRFLHIPENSKRYEERLEAVKLGLDVMLLWWGHFHLKNAYKSADKIFIEDEFFNVTSNNPKRFS